MTKESRNAVASPTVPGAQAQAFPTPNSGCPALLARGPYELLCAPCDLCGKSLSPTCRRCSAAPVTRRGLAHAFTQLNSGCPALLAFFARGRGSSLTSLRAPGLAFARPGRIVAKSRTVSRLSQVVQSAAWQQAELIPSPAPSQHNRQNFHGPQRDPTHSATMLSRQPKSGRGTKAQDGAGPSTGPRRRLTQHFHQFHRLTLFCPPRL